MMTKEIKEYNIGFKRSTAFLGWIKERNTNFIEDDYITINGVTLTFKETAVEATDVEIGATIDDSLNNLYIKINSNVESKYGTNYLIASGYSYFF